MLRQIISADVDGSGGAGGVFFALPLDGRGVLLLLPFTGGSTCTLFFFFAMLSRLAKERQFATRRCRVVQPARRLVNYFDAKNAGRQRDMHVHPSAASDLTTHLPCTYSN